MEHSMTAIEMNNDQTLFRCPDCGACKWEGELRLPGGLTVICSNCGWKERVEEIERQLREGL
jgi:predicted RNA-binding Zn-ribbon protein involved in translation (DUF1610 family)